MTTQDPVGSLLDRWDAALGADPRADLDSFIGAEGRHLDEGQRAEFRRRAETLARVNRGLDQAVAVSSGPLSGVGSSPSPDAASSEFAAGMEPVPGYTLESRIGKGGFGEVWRARAPGGRSVALKIIARRSDALRMELESLEHIKNVHHPHLLAVHASWSRGDRLFIAMELAAGTLFNRWQQAKEKGGTGIPRKELLQYMHEAAEGIDFLNSPQGERPAMQHGDIKPQNLLLMGGHVKVGDFGLIRPLSSPEADHHGTMTVQYAAPEFLEGKLTAASDQFSLAGTYHFLRTGKLPFSGNLLEYRDAIRKGRPDLGDLPAAEREVVRKALSVAPHERFASCTAFVAALEAAAGAGPVALPRRFLLPAAVLATCLIAVAALGIARIRDGRPPEGSDPRPDPAGPLVIPGPRPPGPAEPSLARLEEHHRRWRKTFDDDDARDARWVASPLVLSAHAGLRGDHAAEANLLRHYWARFMQATKPSAALAFAREIADLMRTEEKFFAETVDSGNYFSLGDSDSPAALASPLQPHLRWPRFSRLWPFDQSLRLMKYGIDSSAPMRALTEAQFRGRMAQRPYDFVEEVLDADDVFETLHPNVNRRKKPQAHAAVEIDTLSLLADVVAYCRRIPAPPDQVARDTAELQRDLLRMADTLSQDTLTDAAILPVAEKLVPLCEELGRDAPRDEDRDTAERVRKRFTAIVATMGSGPEAANAAEPKPVALLGLPIRTQRLLVVWFEEELPGIQAMAREQLVQRAIADLVLALGPEVEVNLLVAKGPPVPLPDLKPTPWAFDAPVRADKAGRAKLLEALQAAERDAPFPTEPCVATLERAFAAADSIETTIVFIRLRSPLKLAAAAVAEFSQPRQGLVVHGIVAEPGPPIVSLASAHGGAVVEIRLNGDGIFGDVKPTLLDPPAR